MTRIFLKSNRTTPARIRTSVAALSEGVLLLGLGIGAFLTLRIGLLNYHVLDFWSLLFLAVHLDVLYLCVSIAAFGGGFVGLKIVLPILNSRRFTRKWLDRMKFTTAPCFWAAFVIFGFFILYNKHIVPTYYSDFPSIDSWEGLMIVHWGKKVLYVLLCVVLAYLFLQITRLIYRTQSPLRNSVLFLIVAHCLVFGIVLGRIHEGRSALVEPPELLEVAGEKTLAVEWDGEQLNKRPWRMRRASVLIVGWDGATWEVMDALLEQRKLPNVRWLIEQGRSCVSESLAISNSAMVWNSISTGRLPQDHGIVAFTEHPLWGLVHPVQFTLHGAETRAMNFLDVWHRRMVPSYRVRVPTIWEVARDLGPQEMDCGVINWFGSSPAQKVRGYMLTDHFYDRIKRSLAEHKPLDSNAYGVEFFGPNLLDGTSAFRPMVDEAWEKHLIPFGEYTAEKPGMASVDIDHFLSFLIPELLMAHQPELFMCIFHGTDPIGHYYWPAYEPNLYSPRLRRESEGQESVMPGYYEYLDHVLGQILAAVDLDETCVLLISDHGMEPVLGAAAYQRASHDNQTPGILVCAGKGIEPSPTRGKCSILDVFPMAATLLGLPLSEELEGSYHPEFFRAGYLDGDLPVEVPSYGRRNFQPLAHTRQGDVTMDEEHLKRLKNIGYFN